MYRLFWIFKTLTELRSEGDFYHLFFLSFPHIIYGNKVRLTEDSVPNLLSAANLFQLIPLREGCAEFMMNHVTVANCIGVFFFAKAHHCNILALKAKEIINNKVRLHLGHDEKCTAVEVSYVRIFFFQFFILSYSDFAPPS